MGEAEKAISYNVATSCSDSALALQAQSVRYHLQKCFEARKVNAWDTILKETQSAVTLGADSSPQVSLNGLNTSLIPLLCMSAGFIDQLLTKTIFMLSRFMLCKQKPYLGSSDIKRHLPLMRKCQNFLSIGAPSYLVRLVVLICL